MIDFAQPPPDHPRWGAVGKVLKVDGFRNVQDGVLWHLEPLSLSKRAESRIVEKN